MLRRENRRVDWSSIIVSQSHGSLWSALCQSMNWRLGSPLLSGCIDWSAPLQVSLSRTLRSPAFAYICQPWSGIHDFDLVMTTSLKLEVIFLRRNSSMCTFTFEYYLGNSANSSFSICVWILSHSVTENQLLAQPKLGIRYGWRYKSNAKWVLNWPSVCISSQTWRLQAKGRQK